MIKWLTTVAVLGLLVASGARADEYDFLEQFNNAFANYSGETELELQVLRQWNSDLIEEFNRELLLELGRIVPEMRAADATFLEQILAVEDLDEECRYQVFYLRDVYLQFQNSDIRYCAYYAFNGVDQDSKNRFFPYHNPFAKENSRASYQVVQTLGRHAIYDVEGLQYELQEQLDYYRNLRDGQTAHLWEEIAAHADTADVIYRQLGECRVRIEELQQGDHDYIMNYVNNNCFISGNVTTTPLPETTVETTAQTTDGTTAETTEGTSTETTAQTTDGTTAETTEGTTAETTEGTSVETTAQTTVETTAETTVETTEGTTAETTEGTTAETTEGTTVETTVETTADPTVDTTDETTVETTLETTDESTPQSIN